VEVGALGIMCVALVVGVLIGLLVGAVILRSACHFCSVAVPTLGSAMGIVFIRAIVTGLVGFGIGFVTALVAKDSGLPPAALQAIPSLISLPINFLIAAGIYTAALDVSFGRALLVHLVEFLIVLVIAVVIIVVVVGVLYLTGGSLPQLNR